MAANAPAPGAAARDPQENPSPGASATSTVTTPWLASPEWTRVLPQTDHLNLFLQTAWANSDLGALETWGPALRFAATMVFGDSRPSCVYWGPRRTAMYNEQFKVLAANAHPRLMGQPFKVGFPELEEGISQVFSHVENSGTTVDVDNIELFTERDGSGFLEETYFTGQFIPLRGDDGAVRGVYNTTYETTKTVCHERWRQLTNSIAALEPGTVDQNAERMVEIMRSNPRGIPMAVLYSCEESDSSDTRYLHLKGSIGIPDGHRILAPTWDVTGPKHGIGHLFSKALDRTGQTVLEFADTRLVDEHGHVFQDIEWAGFGEPSQHIVLTPLADSAGRTLGLLVHGINPRRPFDDNARLSIMEMTRQMEAKWMQSISSEEALTRERMLERQLTDSERRMRHMAQTAPVGILLISLEGLIEFGNDQYYDMAGCGRIEGQPTIDQILDAYEPEDAQVARTHLMTLFTGATRVTQELRLKRKWSPAAHFGDPEAATEFHAWVLATGVTVIENGEVVSVMGFMTDISHQKWAEDVQSRNAAAATLARRQQEQFIDTTSHEMRNPLMAMTHLADGIVKCMTDLSHGSITLEQYKSIVEGNVEDATTILACANHQKRIIDDVLILSRLESQMLSITPVPERPAQIVESAVHMFSGQAAANDIKTGIVKDPSFDALNAHHILCDPSRLIQVLINLFGNAVKFTSTEPVRNISLTYGAQSQPPKINTQFGEMTWLPVKDTKRHNALLSDQNDAVYIYFLIEDTGPGLMKAEIDKLFLRFSQGISRGTASYEGSGLGLYICRELTEKQGGQVGVASELGKGSVFGFYIRTSRVPETAINDLEMVDAPLSNGTPVGEHVMRQTGDTNDSPFPPPAKQQIPISSSVGHCFHVMLVEDNLINQRVMAKQLRKAGCTVTVANHGAEAIELLKKTDCWRPERLQKANGGCRVEPIPIDILVLDWEMPVMNGLECASRIRELQASGDISRHLPIISITANIREEQIAKALAAGMDDVLPKPFTIADLLSKLSEMLKPIPLKMTNGTTNGDLSLVLNM